MKENESIHETINAKLVYFIEK